MLITDEITTIRTIWCDPCDVNMIADKTREDGFEWICTEYFQHTSTPVYKIQFKKKNNETIYKK